MIQTFQSELKKYRPWQILQKELLKDLFPGIKIHHERLGYYDLISVLVDGNGEPVKVSHNEQDTKSYLAFTKTTLLNRISRAHTAAEISSQQYESINHNDHHLRTFMLGDLIHYVSEDEKVQSIKINPVLFNSDNMDGDLFLCEEVIFAPVFDKVTQKYMMTDPDQALALLAINPKDMERFGIEIIFHALTNSELPEEREQRDKVIREKIEQLAFYSPRIPIKRGSASIYCVIINLENEMEETAFIRQYKTFDKHSDVIFLNSNLELQTGELERIPYDGDKIDTIFTPIIQWQREKHRTIWG